MTEDKPRLAPPPPAHDGGQTAAGATTSVATNRLGRWSPPATTAATTATTEVATDAQAGVPRRVPRPPSRFAQDPWCWRGAGCLRSHHAPRAASILPARRDASSGRGRCVRAGRRHGAPFDGAALERASLSLARACRCNWWKCLVAHAPSAERAPGSRCGWGVTGSSSCCLRGMVATSCGGLTSA